MHANSKTRRYKLKPSSALDRLLSLLLIALLLIGQPVAVVQTMAVWTPVEGSVPPPAVLTVNAFAAQDLSGILPEAELVMGADGALYGSTTGGGAYGHGTLFKVAADGTFTKLHDFDGADGGDPHAALVIGADGAFYGSTGGGGANDYGTLFKLAADGTFTKLHDFDFINGNGPESAMVMGPDGAFYGSTEGGGASDLGTLFRLATDGTFTKLHDFNGTDGAFPGAPLVVGAEGALYGHTGLGGLGDFGTLFKWETNGTFTKLHDFNGTDGTYPAAALVLAADGALYGSTFQGGAADFGTLFRLEIVGTFTQLRDFTATDGVNPSAALAVGPDGALYGSAQQGGTNDKGTLFKLETTGAFTKLHDFNGADGHLPLAPLVVGTDGALYGSTLFGDTNDTGTLFKLEINGVFTKLHDFDNTASSAGYAVGPQKALVVGANGAMYGTTARGGVANYGMLFKLETGGTFTKLHDFSSAYKASPQSPLVVGSDGALYGSTLLGGVSGLGTLFKVAADGTFTKLHEFSGADGAHPAEAALVLGPDGALYGSTPQGGAGGYGTLFRVTATGTFTKLHDFNGTDGRIPLAALVVGADGAFYGSTVLGGTSDFGTLFKLAANGTFTKLHDFDGADGAELRSSLFLSSDGVLYGVTSASGGLGASNSGTLFKLESNGTFTKLHDFTGPDGYDPVAGLVVGPDGALYGSTEAGGTDGLGILFKLDTNGTFTMLHEFDGANGAEPRATLAVGGDGALYGSTQSGGADGYGTLFKLSTDGTFTQLHGFSNDGGQYPLAALVVGPDGALYGSTSTRSGGGPGTLFKLATNGTFTHLHNFNTVDGRFPLAAMVVGPDGALYGSTQNGGPLDGGILFKLVLPAVQQTPVISWVNPGNIVVGTPLSGTQLNATAFFNGSPVAGAFTYNPPAGTLLALGNAQTLSVTFTPDDAIHFSAASASASINVVPVNHPPVIGNSLPDSVTAPFGGGFYYGPAANTFVDPDAGQTLTITATGMPPGIIFDPVAFLFSGVSEVPGEFVVTLTATDNGTPALSAQDSMIFIITRLGQATDFNPNAGGTVFSTAVQPDGKIVIGGGLNTVGGVARVGVARVNADGTVDTAFNPNVNSFTYSTGLQADGQIVIAGSFTSVGGAARNRIARINGDGTLDTGFNPDANGAVYNLALQPDGKIIVVGQFTTVGGTARNRVARLHADGTLDAGFNPDVNDYVVTAAVQPDGKIVIGGGFTTVGGTARNRLARLNADGTLDAGFNPNVNGEISSLALQADGKILFGGQFNTVGGTGRSRMARLNADGTVDSGFNPNLNGDVASIAVQADGQIVIGGHFNTVGGIARNRIALLYSSGALAPIFNPNANDGVHNVALQADGQILVGGQFTTLGGQPRNRFARLFNDAAIDVLTVPSAARVQWLRGGSAPETSHVTFELSTDGTTWTALGSGTRISGGWELAGLGLPSEGIIRARARTHGGQYNGASGLVEQQTSVSGLPLLPEIALEFGVGTYLVNGVSSIDFGAVNVGDGFSPPTLTLRSLGRAPLNVSAIETTGGNAGDFAVRLFSVPTPLPGTLAAEGGAGTFEVLFQPTAGGSRSATLRILSNDPDESPFEIALTGVGVPNSPPTDIVLNNASVLENEPVATAVGSLTAADPNAGNTHAFTLVSGAGDADNAFFSIVGNELRTAAGFNFEVRNSFSIRVRATDNRGLSFEKTLAVSVLNVNDRPVANPQSVTTAENTPVAITLTGTDEENGLMSFAIISDPTHGTLSGSAPNVVYTPALDYSGPDSFTFLLSDGALASTVVTVSITVNAVALIPEIDALSPSSAIADGPAFTLTVTGENFDAGTTLRWNGGNRPTTYVGPGQVTAQIPATDLVADGDFAIALVTVTRSSGMASDPVAFTIIGVDVGGAVGEVDSGVAVAGNAVSVETLPSAPDSPGVTAYFENTEGAVPATVTVATYTENPTGANAFEAGGGFVDLKVSGADVGDYLESVFFYPQTVTGAAEAALTLKFFNGTAWVDVLSSGGVAPDKNTTDDQYGTVSGGTFEVVFDDTSTPQITELNGTIFAVAIPDTTPPTVACLNVTVNCSAALETPVTYPAPTVGDNADPAPQVTYSIASGSGFRVGVTIVTCTATDAAGNSASTTFTVTRAPLQFTGFLSPIGGADATGGSFAAPVRTFKVGSTIPVKFSAACGGSPVTTGIHRLQAVQYTDATAAGTPIDATPQDAATTGNQFRLSGQDWHFNLDTKNTGVTKGIWQLVVTLSDGSQHLVWVQIK